MLRLKLIRVSTRGPWKTINCCEALWVLKHDGLALQKLDDPLLWRHDGRDGVSNHQPHHCLLNRLFWRRSKKTSKLRVTGLCAGNSPMTGESLHKWSVTRKMFPFDNVIMRCHQQYSYGPQHNQWASCLYYSMCYAFWKVSLSVMLFTFNNWGDIN